MLSSFFMPNIEGWVGRLMKWRNREVQNSCNKNSVKFANGKFTPFPSFFDVDFTIYGRAIVFLALFTTKN
ncbi:hypothetical protein R6Q57_018853 [Mikania cordata]